MSRSFAGNACLRVLQLLNLGFTFGLAQTAPPTAGQVPPGRAIREAGDIAFRTLFTQVAKQVLPTVVSIQTERTVRQPGSPRPFGPRRPSFEGDPFEFFLGQPGPTPQPRREQGLGSGVIIGADGLVSTDNHVVEGAQKLTVQLSDNRKFPARLVGIPPTVKDGVVVTGLASGSRAADAGLQPGDILLEADRKALQSIGNLRSALKKAGNTLLLVSRQGNTFYTALSRS